MAHNLCPFLLKPQHGPVHLAAFNICVSPAKSIFPPFCGCFSQNKKKHRNPHRNPSKGSEKSWENCYLPRRRVVFSFFPFFVFRANIIMSGLRVDLFTLWRRLFAKAIYDWPHVLGEAKDLAAIETLAQARAKCFRWRLATITTAAEKNYNPLSPSKKICLGVKVCIYKHI